MLCGLALQAWGTGWCPVCGSWPLSCIEIASLMWPGKAHVARWPVQGMLLATGTTAVRTFAASQRPTEGLKPHPHLSHVLLPPPT